MIFHKLIYYLNACFSHKYFVFENEIFIIKEMQTPTYFGLFFLQDFNLLFDDATELLNLI